MRTVIIWNSGSGKTWLANRYAERSGMVVVHLDELFRLPGAFNMKRPAREVSRRVEAARGGERWVAEGV